MKTPGIPTPAKILLMCILGSVVSKVYAQRSMPEVLDTGTIQEQFDYLYERTRIYNDFRAIREDMFQKIKSNTYDSLTVEKNRILQFEGQLLNQRAIVDSLAKELQDTHARLDLAIKNRDRIGFLSIPMHKAFYNTILWAIVGALAFLLSILFLSNKRLLSSSRRNKKDLEETKEEFEAYRQQSRERQEQLVVRHHNEMRKLKGR